MAQINQNEPVRFGVKAGLNFSHMNFSKGSPPPEIPISTNWQPGILIGVAVIIPVLENFYFQPEYLFTQMGGKVEEENLQYKINYISLPVILKYRVFNRLSLLGGPQFDLLINGNEEMGGNNSSIEHSIEHRSIGIMGGVEVSLFPKLSVGCRYIHGFNHIGLSRQSNVQEFKFQSFQISATYLLF